MLRLLITITLLATLCSCTKSKLQTAIEMSGDNKKELLVVLDYYSKNEQDSLKRKAAQYLIENMPYHYYFEQQLMIEGTKKDTLSWTDYKLKEQDISGIAEYSAIIDSVNVQIIEGNSVKWDINTINSQQLIENIEYAFKAWKFPWCKHLNFNEFCQYILPYRCKREPLSDWRRSFYEQYSWIKDSLPDDASPYQACIYLQKVLKKQVFWSSKHSGFYSGFLPPALFKNVKIGSCENLACYTSLVMRSVGIPVLYDEVLYWPRQEAGHAYNWLVSNDTVPGYLFSITDGVPDIPKSPQGATKIYRQSYEIHENPVWQIWEEGGFAPSSLINQHHLDVTNQYCTTDTFRYKIEKRNSLKEIIWLCNITPNGLRAIDYCCPDKNGFTSFNNVTQNLFALGSYDESGVLIPVSPPFIHKKGATCFFITEKDSFQNYTFNKRLVLDEKTNNVNREISLQYWDNGWITIAATAVLAEDTNSHKNRRKRLFEIKLNKVPKGTVFYLKETKDWFTFDSKEKYEEI